MEKLTNAKRIDTLQRMSNELSFLVNVIQCQHSKPMTKIRGLYNLVNAGHSVRTAQCDIDVLLIDDEHVSWSILEEYASTKR